VFDRTEALRVLDEEALDAVHARAMTILEEIGTDVRQTEALALLRDAGQAIDGERVRWDREFVREMVARAPASFTLAGRSPDRAVTIGDAAPPWGARRSAPTASADAATARSPTMSSS
jgi:trimethylamine--corrinoid protein Co-methyltransferase